MDWPNYFELIVSMRVAEIASADFSRHVPAVERDGRKLESAAIECHGGHSWEGVPSQSQLLEPIESK